MTPLLVTAARIKIRGSDGRLEALLGADRAVAAAGELEHLACACRGISADAVYRAIGHGWSTADQLKRATRVAFGECQGRRCVPWLAARLELEPGDPRARLTRARRSCPSRRRCLPLTRATPPPTPAEPARRRQQLLDEVDELAEVERLADDRRRSAQAVRILVADRGAEQDRDVAVLRPLAEGSHDLGAVLVRQHLVEDEQLRLLPATSRV